MYEPVLVDEKSDLYNVYEVHENYRILAMAVNVPLQVAEEICHILNEFEIKSLQPCPKCGYQPIIRELPNGGYKIVCRVCDLTTGLFNHKQNLINYWNTAICEEAVRYLQEDYETKKPVAIEAFQFDGDLKGSDGKYYVPEWAVKAFKEGILYFDALTPDTPPIELFIKTLEGTMHAPVGSYVIQGVRGEIYCCKEDIFLETYEPVLERE